MAWKKSSACLLACCSVAIAADLQRFEAVEPHMGTLVRVTLYAPGEDAANRAFRAAFTRIAALDAAFSDYRQDSELMRLSRTAHQRPVTLSADLYKLLEASQRIARASDGAFDITLGPLIQLWREARRARRLPDPSAIAKAKLRCGYQHLLLDPVRRTARFNRDGMLLDPGGIAKGYAAAAMLEALRSAGTPRALVAVSGDLAIGDPPPGRSAWLVAIDPGEKRTLALQNVAVSTSGDAEQNVDIDTVRYSHIIDPRTGIGLRSGIGVTVVAPDAAAADALATAVSVIGPKAGLRLIARKTNVEALCVENGRTFETPGLKRLARR